MKKRFAIVLSVMLIAGLTGCGAKEEKASVTQTTEEVIEEQATETETTGEPVTEEMTEETAEETTTTEEEAAVSVTYEEEINNRFLEDGTMAMEVFYKNPVVSIPDYIDAQQLIQEDLNKRKEDFDISVNELESDARTFVEETKDIESEMGPYKETVEYETKRADRKVISLLRSEYSYSGGAHGYTLVYGLNYDSSTGNLLTLDDISEDKEALVTCVKNYIYDECDNGAYKDDVFPDYKPYVDNVVADDLWYFDEEGITFIANAYELGPYAMGTIYFHISYDELDGLKEAYRN